LSGAHRFQVGRASSIGQRSSGGLRLSKRAIFGATLRLTFD
jgi:hypothetical protein